MRINLGVNDIVTFPSVGDHTAASSDIGRDKILQHIARTIRYYLQKDSAECAIRPFFNRSNKDSFSVSITATFTRLLYADKKFVNLNTAG